jgi:hypothetical protein
MNRSATVLFAAAVAFSIPLGSIPRSTAAPFRSPMLSRCLVGTWREVGETDVVGIAGGLMTLRGDAGRVLTIGKAGTERLDYSHATPLLGTYRATKYKIVLRGSILLGFTVNGDRVKFVKSDYSHFVETFTSEGKTQLVPMSGLPRTVTVNCGIHTLAQTSLGYHGTFTRAAV